MGDFSKKRKISNIRLFSVVLLMLFSMVLVGCSENFTGTRIGFRFAPPDGLVAVAVRSDQNEFYINDVSLEFHFGWFDNHTAWGAIGVALYFVNDYEMFYGEYEFHDYKNRNGAEFFRMIDIEYFLTENFKMQNRRHRSRVFNHHEIISIKNNHFNEYPSLHNRIIFAVDYVYYCEAESIYRIIGGGKVEITYIFVTENIIRFIND